MIKLWESVKLQKNWQIEFQKKSKKFYWFIRFSVQIFVSCVLRVAKSCSHSSMSSSKDSTNSFVASILSLSDFAVCSYNVIKDLVSSPSGR